MRSALNQRRRADPRIVFDQSFEWGQRVVVLRFGEVAGRLDCIGIEIMGGLDETEQQPLTALALRRIPFGRLAEQARDAYRAGMSQAEQLEASGPSWNPDLSRNEREALIAQARESFEDRRHLVEATGEDRRLGRPRIYGADHFAKVAEVYVDGYRDPARKTAAAPTKAVADHFGVSHSAAAKWVARARAMGLIAPTSKGKASGLPAPRSGKDGPRSD